MRDEQIGNVEANQSSIWNMDGTEHSYDDKQESINLADHVVYMTHFQVVVYWQVKVN